jgi:hypothetical protein
MALRDALGEEIAARCISVTERERKSIEGIDEPLAFLPSVEAGIHECGWVGPALLEDAPECSRPPPRCELDEQNPYGARPHA